jgi:hypothetical protein
LLALWMVWIGVVALRDPVAAAADETTSTRDLARASAAA